MLLLLARNRRSGYHTGKLEKYANLLLVWRITHTWLLSFYRGNRLILESSYYQVKKEPFFILSYRFLHC